MAGLFGGINLDFGAPKGLALRVDTQQDIANIRADEVLQRQKEIDARTKAKLFADNIQFGNASNPWDHKLLKEFSEKRVREMGSFATQNPDWDTDPQKLLQLKVLGRGLVDNDIVLRSERIKQHNAQMNEWHNDPKNKELLSLPGVVQKRQEYENYVRTGSADGIAENKKEFVWQQPEIGVDLSGVFAQRAGSIDLQGSRDFQQGNKFVTEKFVRREDVMAEAMNMVADKGPIGIAIRKQYQDLVDAGGLPENTSIEQYVFDGIWNNRKAPKQSAITTQQFSSRNGGGQGQGHIAAYDDLYKFPDVQPSHAVLHHLVQQTKNGVYTTQEGIHLNMAAPGKPAEFIPIPGSLNRFIKGQPVPTKEISPTDKDLMFIKTKYEIPLEDPNFIDIVEGLGSLGQLESSEIAQILGNNFDEAEDIVNKSKGSIAIRSKTDKDGEEVGKFLELTGWTPSRRNVTARSLYSQEFHSKNKVGFSNEFPSQGVQFVSSDGKWGWDGTKAVPLN